MPKQFAQAAKADEAIQSFRCVISLPSGFFAPVYELVHVWTLVGHIIDALIQQVHHERSIVEGVFLTPLHVLHVPGSLAGSLQDC